MNSRERVLAALNHETPDRVPVDLGSIFSSIHKKAYRKLLDFLDMKDLQAEGWEWIQQIVVPDERLLVRFGVDTRYLDPGVPKGKDWQIKEEEDEKYYYKTDAWGIKRAMPKEGGLYFDIVKHPLQEATLKDLEEYQWPDVTDAGFTEGLRGKAAELHNNTDYAVIGFTIVPQYETAWYLRGYQDFYMDMIRNPKFVETLLDKLTELNMRYIQNLLDVIGDYIHVFMLGDDFAHQNGLLLSPDLYRHFVKPRQKKTISMIKEITDAKVFFHSCGSIYHILQDLIEVGVDVINPVQVTAKDMDSPRLKLDFGDRLCFWGGIETQNVLPFGNANDVEREVKRRINDLGRKGGYILAAVHNIQADVPPENIVAMFDAARKWGKC